jgi:hypothetical protein
LQLTRWTALGRRSARKRAEVRSIYSFRNTHVAHVNVGLQDRALAEAGLTQCIAARAL